jgi:hypothetical protein
VRREQYDDVGVTPHVLGEPPHPLLVLLALELE